MTNKPELLNKLNRLKREEQILKLEEATIRQARTTQEQRAPLALNQEKRMKNRRDQGRISAELLTASPEPPAPSPGA